MMSGFVGQIKS